MASKVSHVMSSILGMDIRARPWEAKPSHLLELERRKLHYDHKKRKEEWERQALKSLIRDMGSSGSNKEDVDLGELLMKSLGSPEPSLSHRERLDLHRHASRYERKNHVEKPQEMSLVERERQAKLELEAQRLTLMKIVGQFVFCISRWRLTVPSMTLSNSNAEKKLGESWQPCKRNLISWAIRLGLSSM